MKPAFSTVACPEFTLRSATILAEELGYLGLELRTFGDDSRGFASDPALTDSSRVRTILHDAGVDPACLATHITFDEPVDPPLLGHVIADAQKPVRLARSAIGLAAQIECPFVRVFAFDRHGSEPRARALARILERLTLALDACRNTGVRLVIENGGGFTTATDLAEIMDRAGSPLLGAAYSVAVAAEAGEDPAAGINVLGDRLQIIKLRDFKDRTPCAIGWGDVPNRSAVETLGRVGFKGWAVVEFDRAWIKDLPEPAPVLKESIANIYQWLGRSRTEPRPARRVAARA